MPWSSSDADRFKRGLSTQQKERWASIANSVLERGGSEASAVRSASGAITHPSGTLRAAKRRLQKVKKKPVSLEA